MTEEKQRETTMAIRAPTARELRARIEADKLPTNVGRRLSAIVTGVATFGFGALTAALIAFLMDVGLGRGVIGIVAGLIGIAVFGSMTTGFAFLTWRWSRGLPPSKSLALTEREKDELS